MALTWGAPGVKKLAKLDPTFQTKSRLSFNERVTVFCRQERSYSPKFASYALPGRIDELLSSDHTSPLLLRSNQLQDVELPYESRPLGTWGRYGRQKAA